MVIPAFVPSPNEPQKPAAGAVAVGAAVTAVFAAAETADGVDKPTDDKPVAGAAVDIPNAEIPEVAAGAAVDAAIVAPSAANNGAFTDAVSCAEVGTVDASPAPATLPAAVEAAAAP